MNCNIRLLLDSLVYVLEVILTQDWFTATLGGSGFHRAGFPHSFFQAVNSAGIDRKAFCDFLCIVCLVSGFDE